MATVFQRSTGDSFVMMSPNCSKTCFHRSGGIRFIPLCVAFASSGHLSAAIGLSNRILRSYNESSRFPLAHGKSRMARIPLKQLSELCRRTATSHAAGVDARKIWKREASTGNARKRRELGKVSQAIDRGSTLYDALAQTDNYLPKLVRDLVYAGEQTGKIDQVLNRLGQYYEFVRSLRTAFLVGIAWPMFQLVIAVLVVGLVIYISGLLQSGSDQFDMVGFGLMGGRGALIYFAIVGAISAGAYLLIRSLLMGKLSNFVMGPLMKVPIVGKSLRLMALSRLSWALGMAVESGVDINKSLEVAINSTQNSFYTRHLPGIQSKIKRGETLYDALLLPDVFPEDFLDAVAVGEESGKLEESLTRLAAQYEEQGKAAMSALAVASGILVWVGVGVFIIYFIFRFAMFYLGILEDAMTM